jgi:HEPN domain-containing protein
MRAEDDLTAAEHLLTLASACPFATVCFHAQQCAEEYLKALLTFHSIPFPRTHDLGQVLSLVPKKLGLEISVPDVAAFNLYAAVTRHPGDWDPVDRPEAVRAVTMARRVQETVRGLLPAEALSEPPAVKGKP